MGLMPPPPRLHPHTQRRPARTVRHGASLNAGGYRLRLKRRHHEGARLRLFLQAAARWVKWTHQNSAKRSPSATGYSPASSGFPAQNPASTAWASATRCAATSTSLHPYIHSTPDEAFEQARHALDSQPQLRAFVSADVAHLASARAASFSSDSNASQFVTGPTCANSTMPLRSRM